MKKIIAIITVLTLLFSMTACAGQEVPLHTENWGKRDVLETSEYSVKVDSGEDVLDENAPRLHGEGTYVSTIVGGVSENYTVTTKLTFEGYYLLKNGSQVPVNDVVTSSATFKDLSNNFRPIKSEKEYNGKTVKFENNEYTVDDLKYTSSIEYGEKKATVKNTIDGQTASLEISTPSTMFIDNEMLFYIIRSFVKKEGASISFSLINGLSNTAIPMTAGVNANSIVEIPSNIDGVAQTLKTYPVALRKSSNSETGSTQHIFCAVDDEGEVNRQSENGGKVSVDRSRVVKILQQVPYTMDYLEFNLVKYTYGE